MFHSGDGHTYTLQAQTEHKCVYDNNGHPCLGATDCVNEQGERSVMYDILKDGAKTGEETCLSSGQAGSLGAISPMQVLYKARRLHWPAGTLVIQPPGGETLVNLPTIFYTTSTQTVTQTFPLLGRQITVQAWPASYTWVYGDGVSHTSTIPGRKVDTADPNGKPILDGTIHHEYVKHGVVSARLDLTYEGRWRVGNGPWQALPGTLTVPGAPQTLHIYTAHPVLVPNPPGYDS